MIDLTEFLLARIAEDEAVAREAATWDDGMYFFPWQAHIPQAGYFNSEQPYGAVEFSAARVLAECEAKRRIVAMLDESLDFTEAMPTPGYARAYHSPSLDVLVRVEQILALPYAQHPDYRQEWTP
jgi:hypothetical protein